MEKIQFYIKSTNDINDIHCIMWKPKGEILAILQISHGMVEYIDRYDRFATFLAYNGILVVGNDHLGHGLSVNDDEELGYFNCDDASKTVVEDLHKITDKIKREYGNIPYFVLGHSMGSFLIRRYMMTYQNEVDGYIIMGTGSQPKIILKLAKFLLNIIKLFKGDRYRSKFVTKLAFGAYNNDFKPVVTQSDWISRDREIVQKYINDKYCTFLFTLNGYKTLFDTLEFIQISSNIKKLSKNIPLFLVSGDKDPVGNKGKDVKNIYEEYKNLGIKDIEIKLYKDCRHEILNELNYEEIYDDIYNWIKLRLKNVQKAL